MHSKMISLLVAAVLVLGVGALVYLQNRDVVPVAAQGSNATSTETQTGVNAQPSASEPTPQQTSGITSAEVARHANRTDCWTIINGAVYDMTSWIPNHPGGEAAIVQLCGTDGSAKFNTMHGGNSRQLTVLAGFRIGALAQ